MSTFCSGLKPKILYGVDVTEEMFTSLAQGSMITLANTNTNSSCEVKSILSHSLTLIFQ